MQHVSVDTDDDDVEDRELEYSRQLGRYEQNYNTGGCSRYNQILNLDLVLFEMLIM